MSCHLMPYHFAQCYSTASYIAPNCHKQPSIIQTILNHSRSHSATLNHTRPHPITPNHTACISHHPTYIPLPDFRSRPYMHLQLHPTHPTLLPCSYQLCIATPTRTIPTSRWRAECTSSLFPPSFSTNPISPFPSSHPASSGR